MMRRFKDSEGREYGVRLTVSVLRDLRSRKGMTYNDLFQRAMQGMGDPLAALEMLGACCAKQLEQHGLTPIEFEDSFDEATLPGAVDALVGAVADFFPNATMRQQLLDVWAAGPAKLQQLMQSQTT